MNRNTEMAINTLIGEFSRKLAKDLLEVGDEPDSKVQRIQFMGGAFPDNEKKQGGLCEKALADFFEQKVREFLRY